jgi:hypothetical protein
VFELINWCLKALVRLYQILLSPFLVALGVGCRFYPSCSHYAIGSLERDPWPRALVKISPRFLYLSYFDIFISLKNSSLSLPYIPFNLLIIEPEEAFVKLVVNI